MCGTFSVKLSTVAGRSRYPLPAPDEQTLLDELRVRLVEPAELPRFQRLLHRLHYLKSLKPVGERLSYVATHARGEWLGLLIFNAAAKHLKLREAWIGWTSEQAWRRLSLVVETFVDPDQFCGTVAIITSNTINPSGCSCGNCVATPAAVCKPSISKRIWPGSKPKCRCAVACPLKRLSRSPTSSSKCPNIGIATEDPGTGAGQAAQGRPGLGARS